jgi:hypothetical protein
MKPLILALALGLASPALADESKSPDVTDTSFVTADGGRDLQQSIVIAAPVAVLWKSFTDSAEFRRWAAPVAAIDLRVGGCSRPVTIPSTPSVIRTTSGTG